MEISEGSGESAHHIVEVGAGFLGIRAGEKTHGNGLHLTHGFGHGLKGCSQGAIELLGPDHADFQGHAIRDPLVTAPIWLLIGLKLLHTAQEWRSRRAGYITFGGGDSGDSNRLCRRAPQSLPFGGK